MHDFKFDRSLKFGILSIKIKFSNFFFNAYLHFGLLTLDTDLEWMIYALDFSE